MGGQLVARGLINVSSKDNVMSDCLKDVVRCNILVYICCILTGSKQEAESKGTVKNRTCEADCVKTVASGGHGCLGKPEGGC